MKRKLPFILCAVIMTIFIFLNSMENAAVSTAKSDVFTDAIYKALNAANCSAKRSDIVHIVRKTAHILEFAAQSFLIAFCIDGKFKKRLIYILFFGLLTACTDEYIQVFSAGRASMIQDVFIDFCGTMIGALCARLTEKAAKKG